MSNEVPCGVRTMMWRRGGEVVEGFPLEKVSDCLQEEGALVWVDLCAPDGETLGALADELSLDRHAVEDALATAERPKATRHASHTFVTVYATRLEADGDPGRGRIESRLETVRVSAFVLPNGVVTVRQDDRFDTDEVVRCWQDHGYLPEHGPGALLHGLLDVVVDGHLDTVGVMDEMIEALEDGLFDEAASPRALQQRTYRLRKELVGLRRAVLPMRDVVGTVVRHRADVHGRGELDGWYADLHDHTLRAWDWTESLREMVTTVFETNLALQDARLNTVMKKLTGWAGIVAVPTAVTGWFGMNVAYPGIGRTSGFLASTVVISVLVVSLYVVFKRRNWL